jgi:DNA ligase-1
LVRTLPTVRGFGRATGVVKPVSQPMRRFVETAEAVAATTKKTEKVRLISALFCALPSSDASLAAQFFTGRAFPQFEERVVGVGGSSLARAVATASGRAGERLGKIYRKHGDLGDMAEELLRDSHAAGDLTFQDVAASFSELSAARTQRQKDEQLASVIARASAGDVKYIVKILTGDLRIGSKESLVEEAIAKAFNCDAVDVRRANMFLGDIGETLQLAAQGKLNTATMRLFHPLGFMLASPVETAEELFPQDEAKTVFVEHKFDGIRAQVHKDANGKVKIYSRTRDEVTEFPELYAPLETLPGELILDGEILAWRDGHPMPFTELQKRLGRKRIDMWMKLDIPVKFIAFDLLFENGELLLELPLGERRERLRKIFGQPAEGVALAEAKLCQTAQQAMAQFRGALAAGHEGIMAKAIDSRYTPGRRGGAWMKLKEPFATLDVVVTAAEYGHGKRHQVLSDFTFAVRDGDRLLNIGKAYSGLTDAEIAQYTKFFLEHTVEDQGFRRIVEPKLVIEVAFNNMQRSERHESGFALRFPRIVRVRPDKPASEIDTLARAEELFAKQKNQAATAHRTT